MIGLNKHNAASITELSEHVHHSIEDIISTPIGTRVMLRDYGSLIPELVDQPLNSATILRLYAATAAAIMKWEPRLSISGVHMSYIEPAGALIEVSGSIGDTPITVKSRISGSGL